MKFETLYYFMNERYSVVEIKKEGLPADTPKSEQYFWLSIPSDNSPIQKLNFQSMGEEVVAGNLINIRVFENAEVRFDDAFVKFTLNSEGHILMNVSKQKLPDEVKSKILNKLF